MPEGPTNPFELLGLPLRFDLDEGAITRAWLKRSAVHHPDRQADEAEAGRAMARLNDARHTLSDPERRANRLLALLGGPSKEQDRSLPDGFLQQTLELREEIEQSLAAPGPGERDRLERWALDQRGVYLAKIASLFAALANPPDALSLGAIRTQLNAWRYIERLIEQLDPAYDPARADFAD